MEYDGLEVALVRFDNGVVGKVSVNADTVVNAVGNITPENVAYSAMCFEELTDFAIVGVVGQVAYIHLCIHIILYLLL